MSWNNLLNFFKKEKNFVGRLANDFSRKFPKVAGYLDFSLDSSDPQVNRLLESLSFLHAMTQRKMAGEFEEISSGILQVLSPNMINPIVPMTTVQFDNQNAEAKHIPARTDLGIYTGEGQMCQFQTAYPVEVLPLNVSEAMFESPTRYEQLQKHGNVHRVLRIRVQCLPDVEYEELALDTLRFHMTGESMVVSGLYDMIFGGLTGVAIQSDTQEEFCFLPENSIQAVGFQPDEVILPLSDNVQIAYQLLMEYFCFPAKFHYFDVSNLADLDCQEYFDILLMVSATSGQALDINADNFVLNATPAINLFEKDLTPILLDQNTHEYLLSAADHTTTEVHSIQSVQTSREEETVAQSIEPFFKLRRDRSEASETAYWTTRREISYVEGLSGSNLFLSFVNINYADMTPGGSKVFVRALCSNRGLAEKLTGKSKLFVVADPDGSAASCLTPPTAAIQPALGGATLWKLVNCLNLNFASLTHKDDMEALKQNIGLFNFSESAVNDQQLEGIRSLAVDMIVRRKKRQAWHCFYQGLEVTMSMDHSYFIGSSPLLFGKTLHQFLALYVGVHSFVELVLHRTDQEGEWIRFEKQEGRRPTFL